MEDPPAYQTGPAAALEPPPTTEELVATAHANRQGIPYETGEQLLERLPEQMRALADVILGGKMTVGDVACAVVAPIDRIEKAPAAMDQNRHGFTPPPAALPRGHPKSSDPEPRGRASPNARRKEG